MSDPKKTAVQHDKQSEARNAYETPRLIEFGHVAALTQAGSMAGTEGVVIGMRVGQMRL